jgi:hypothetical protein
MNIVRSVIAEEVAIIAIGWYSWLMIVLLTQTFYFAYYNTTL